MGIFKSSSPKTWSLGFLLLFQQLFPVRGFICFSKGIFLLRMCPGSNSEGFLYITGLLRWSRGGHSGVPLAASPPASCFREAAGAWAPLVEGPSLLLLPGSCALAPSGEASWRSSCHYPHHPALLLLSDPPGAGHARSPRGLHVAGLAGGPVPGPSVASAVSESGHRHRGAQSVAALGSVSPHVPARGSGRGPLCRAAPAPAAEAGDRSVASGRPTLASLLLLALRVRDSRTEALGDRQPGRAWLPGWRLPLSPACLIPSPFFQEWLKRNDQT